MWLQRIRHKLFCKKHYVTKYRYNEKNQIYHMYLECMFCHYETKGWDVTPTDSFLIKVMGLDKQ